MRLLPEPITFLWDKGNLEKNSIKHGVLQQEAEELFLNEPLTVTDDRNHSTVDEQRYFALGKTKSNRKLFAAFTIRDKKIRIISVRDVSKLERIAYEQLEKDS